MVNLSKTARRMLSAGIANIFDQIPGIQLWLYFFRHLLRSHWSGIKGVSLTLVKYPSSAFIVLLSILFMFSGEQNFILFIFHSIYGMDLS